MIYERSHRESNYVSVNNLSKPRKSNNLISSDPESSVALQEQESTTDVIRRVMPSVSVLVNSNISKPNDPAELEADQAAEEVINTPGADISAKQKDKSVVKAKHAGSKEVAADIPNDIHNLGGGNPLDKSERNFFEPRFGADFGNVRVHTDDQATGMAKAINARAFTKGNNIIFAKGEYQPQTGSGKRLIAHELAHVVQQGDNLKDGTKINSRQISLMPIKTLNTSETDLKRENSTGLAIEPIYQGVDILKSGVVYQADPYLSLRQAPTSDTKIVSKLYFNTRVFVNKELPGNWFFVSTENGIVGYIPSWTVMLDPPEPMALLYKIKQGESAIGIAEKNYKQYVKWGSDLRFYVNALVYANDGEGSTKKGIKQKAGRSWEDTEVVADSYIWIPSIQFVEQLKGKVKSGSITYELWQSVKKAAEVVWDFVKFGAGFIAGLVHGFVESIWDVFVGIFELGKMLYSILESLFTGNIIADAKKLWDDISSINVFDIVETWISDFEKKWNQQDSLKRGHFRGWVIGYAIAEIVMLSLGKGIIEGIKVSGKLAKIGKIIKEFKTVKTMLNGIEKVEEKLSPVKEYLKNRKIVKGVIKGKKEIELYLKSEEHLTKRLTAFNKYKGSLSKEEYFSKYDTLMRNKLVGALTEEQFQLFQGGEKLTQKTSRTFRYIDNFRDGICREIKSGYVTLTDSIKTQILKDIEIAKVKKLKIEWHLFRGASPEVVEFLNKSGVIKVVKY